MNARIFLMALTFILAYPVALAGTQVVFVDKDNDSGTEDGLSWATAFREIEPAIDFGMDQVRNNTDTIATEVWVAEGVYDEERVGAVSFKPGILEVGTSTSLLGGFRGDETERADRDPDAHGTVIDGTTSNAGAPAAFTVEVKGVLDGFTVRGQAVENSGISVDTYYNPLPLPDVSGIVLVNTGARIRKCLFQGFHNSHGDGILFGSLLRDVEIEDCRFLNNIGGVLIQFLSSENDVNITYCEFRDNESTLVAFINAAAKFVSCEFRNNMGVVLTRLATEECYYDGCLIEFENCLIVENISPIGDILIDDLVSATAIRSSTIAYNSGGFTPPTSSDARVAYMVDSILWENEGGDLLGVPSEGSFQFAHSNIGVGYMGSASGMLSADPMFVDPLNGDYRLSVFSPCIDAGVPPDSVIPTRDGEFMQTATVDIEKRVRPQGDAADMGAYEHAISYDVDGDGNSNSTDIQNVINSVLGTSSVNLADINMDMRKDAVDVQLMINAVLGVK